MALVGCPKLWLHPSGCGNCCVSIRLVHKDGFSDEVPVDEGRNFWHGIAWVWTFSLILFHDNSYESVRVCDRVWNKAKLELRYYLAM